MAHLELYGENRLLRRIPLEGDGVYVGRHGDCEIALDAPNVSRRHAKLRPMADGRWRVVDLKSANGTAVNGALVHHADLRDGDKIEVGDYCLVFRGGDARAEGLSRGTAPSEHGGDVGDTRARSALEHDLQAFRELHRDRTLTEHDFENVVARDVRMKTVLAQILDVAPSDTTTLLLGESGTGKELLARAIHHRSPRRSRPFVAVNCMALGDGLVESALFGHERGAFTGATERKAGRFELAHGGTLFLDEVGELSAEVQIKLLRVLQERCVERLGSTESRPVDVRVLAATNADLEAKIRDGSFREDLYYRLAVFTIHVPPLRERGGDVMALAEFFVEQFNTKMGKAIRGFTAEAEAALLAYAWPGNVRELRNVVERAFVLERCDRIGPSSLPFPSLRPVRDASDHSVPAFAPEDWPTAFNEAKALFERRFLLAALRRNGGNISATARELDLPRNTVYRKIEGFGLGPEDWEGPELRETADDE